MYILLFVLVFSGCNLNIGKSTKSSSGSSQGYTDTSNNSHGIFGPKSTEGLNDEHNSLIDKYKNLFVDAPKLTDEELKKLSDYNVEYFDKNKKIINNCFYKADVSNKDLSNLNFNGSLNSPNFEYSNIKNTNFNNSSLNEALFYSETFSEAQFKNAQLTDSIFLSTTVIMKSIFDNADMHGEYTQIKSLIININSFIDTKLSQSTFEGIILLGNNFTNANLSDSTISAVDILDNNFTNADLTDAEFIIKDADDKNSDQFKNNTFTAAIIKNTKFIIPKYLGIDDFKVKLTAQGIDVAKVIVNHEI